MNKWRSGPVDSLLFVLMASSWALNYPLLKIAINYEPPLVVLLFRVLFATIFSLPFSYAALPFFKKIGLLKLFIMSLLNVTLFMSLWFIGERTESSALSSILVYTYPIMSVFLSWVALSENPSPGKIIGISIGFVGVVVIFIEELVVSYNIGLILLIASALSWAAGTIFYKKYLRSENMGAINTFQFLFALPVVAAIAFLYGGYKPLNLDFIWITVYMGSVGSSVAYFIYWSLIRKYRVSHVSPYLFSVPALSILFSFLINGETLRPLTLGGFILVAVGIFVSSR